MKKSKINPEDVLEDANKIISIINNLENINLENVDDLGEEISNLEKKLTKKYKDHLEEESEDNLDTEE